MRIRKCRPQISDPDVPRGVRISHADGRLSECTLVRDPEDSAKGHAQWIAEPPPGTVIMRGDTLGVDYLPGKTVIGLRLTVPEYLA